MIVIDPNVTQAIDDYISLASAIRLYIDRDDLSDEQINIFIRLAEARFNRILRTPEMEETGTLTVTTENTTLPADLLQLREVYAEGDWDTPLPNYSPANLKSLYGGQEGVPRAYTLIGRTLRAAPVGDATLNISYYAKIPALTEAEPSNWLLESHADLYLFASLVQAEAYILDPEAVGLWKSALDEGLAELNRAAVSARWGGGPLRASGLTQVRGARC